MPGDFVYSDVAANLVSTELATDVTHGAVTKPAFFSTPGAEAFEQAGTTSPEIRYITSDFPDLEFGEVVSIDVRGTVTEWIVREILPIDDGVMSSASLARNL